MGIKEEKGRTKEGRMGRELCRKPHLQTNFRVTLPKKPAWSFIALLKGVNVLLIFKTHIPKKNFRVTLPKKPVWSLIALLESVNT